MSLSDCPDCRRLFQDATKAIKRQLDASARLSLAVQRDVDTGLTDLKRLLEERSEARMAAVERYENHVNIHHYKVMTSGGSAS